MSSNGNGSIYTDGYAIAQNSALKQNMMNQSIGGKRRLKGGNGTIEVPQIHTAYNDVGNVNAKMNTGLTSVMATQQAQSVYDSKVKMGGSRRRKRRTNKRQKTRKTRKTRKTNRRKSRRHR
jgi:hypothetical protein